MPSAAVLLPLSYHANCELVTFWVCNIPVADEEVKMNKLHFLCVCHFCVKSFPHSSNVWNLLHSFSCQWLSRDGTAAVVILVLTTDGTVCLQYFFFSYCFFVTLQSPFKNFLQNNDKSLSPNKSKFLRRLSALVRA